MIPPDDLFSPRRNLQRYSIRAAGEDIRALQQQLEFGVSTIIWSAIVKELSLRFRDKAYYDVFVRNALMGDNLFLPLPELVTEGAEDGLKRLVEVSNRNDASGVDGRGNAMPHESSQNLAGESTAQG